MRDLSKTERAAIEAVAKRFAAPWESGDHFSDAYLQFAGKRVGIEVAKVQARGSGKSKAAPPGLRFDKVATRVLESLRAALGKVAPGGTTVLLAITAPIRLASKTTAAVQEKMQILLERGSPGRAVKARIYGNRVTIRIIRSGGARAPRMIGFVHNGDTDPRLLFSMTEELLGLDRGEKARPGKKRSGEQWLVAIGEREISCLPAYRNIFSQLRATTEYEKAVMVFAGGSVGVLAE